MPHIYIVQGRGEFPKDMLRRDQSTPATPADEALVDAESGSDLLEEGGDSKLLRRYEVTLQTESRTAPATKRWESFGFKVLAVSPGLLGEPSEGVPPRTIAAAPNAALPQRRRGMSAEASEALDAIRAHTGEDSDMVVIERLLAEEMVRQASAAPRF